jgi:hypothetical protein
LFAFVVILATLAGVLLNQGSRNQGTISAGTTVAPLPTNPDPGDNQVAFYEDINYGGHYMISNFDRDYNDLRSLYVENNPKVNWNDRISSIKVGKNACVTVWKDINYKGAKSELNGNGSSTTNFPNLHSSGWGDNISSYKTRALDNCAKK